MRSKALKVNVTDLPEGETFIEARLSADDLGFADEEVTLREPVATEVRLQKLGPQVLAQARIQAVAETACGRCVERFELPLEGHMVIQYMPASKADREEDEDVELVVPYNGVEIDMTDDVRQTVILSIPIKRVCRPDCRGLCPRCGMNLNKGGCTCHGSSK